MKYVLSVSPDFSPDHIAGWYIFNTWLQQALDMHIHIQLYNSFDGHREAIANDEIDLIYANPYDSAVLIREKGFVPLVVADGERDEAVIAVSNESGIQEIEDLKEGTRIATTDDPDVHMMGMIMLEPADLDKTNSEISQHPSYVVVAKHLIQGNADVGFFLKEAYDDLSKFVHDQLHILVESQIHIIRHSLMLGPRMKEHADRVREVLLSMPDSDKGQDALTNLGFKRWEAMSAEDGEFMIDLMDTLVE